MRLEKAKNFLKKVANNDKKFGCLHYTKEFVEITNKTAIIREYKKNNIDKDLLIDLSNGDILEETYPDLTKILNDFENKWEKVSDIKINGSDIEDLTEAGFLYKIYDESGKYALFDKKQVDDSLALLNLKINHVISLKDNDDYKVMLISLERLKAFKFEKENEFIILSLGVILRNC